MPLTREHALLVGTILASQLLISNLYAAPLQGSEWKPVRMAEMDVAEESKAFVQFRSKGRLSGYSGCNRLFAEYQADSAGTIFIGPVATTRKICDERVMEQERALAAALENARSYQRRGIRMVLFDSEARPVLEMRQTDWD